VAFRGTFDFTLDAKNRLTVPAKFRAALADGVVLARGAERCVEIWPPADFEGQTKTALQRLNPMSLERREVNRRMFAATHDTELDSAGRVQMPPKLLEYARLGRDVTVIGAGDWLEVWDRDAWAAYDEASPDRINELTTGLEHPA
jgi:MraZ protein